MDTGSRNPPGPSDMSQPAATSFSRMAYSNVPALPNEIIEHILHLSSVSTRSEYYAALLPTSSWRYTSHPPLSSSHLAKLCLLSQGLNDAFTPILYRSVVLRQPHAIRSFGLTVATSPRHGRFVRHLAILPCRDLVLEVRRLDVGEDGAAPERRVPDAGPSTADGAFADDILQHCPAATHVLLSRSQFTDWSPGLYSLLASREVTLVGVRRASDLDGLVSRHRQTVTAALQSNPTIQALLNTSSNPQPQSQRANADASTETRRDGTDGAGEAGRPAEPGIGLPEGSSPRGTSSDPSSASSASVSGSNSSPPRQRSTMPRLPLTHLHLVNVDGRLIHHLAQLTSLTHIVLSFPRASASNRDAGVPVIPRSHLLLLLGSGRIRRIVIRASPSVCHQILEEISPIEDEKLIFRPIKLKDEQSSSRTVRPRTYANDNSSAGSSSGSSSSGCGVRQVDLMAEWWERIHLDAMRHRRGDRVTAWASSGSSRDRNNSLSSSEMEADSSWSSDRDRGSSGGDAGSGSGTGSEPGSNHEYYESDVYSDDEGGYADEEDGPWPESPFVPLGLGSVVRQAQRQPNLLPPLIPPPGTPAQPMPAQTAPPPQIPIEMLLAYENLEQARQRRDAGLMVPAVRRRSASRSDEGRRRVRPGAFAARRSDVRGATDAAMERIVEVLAREDEEQRNDEERVGSQW